jgi:ABC-type nickel/cobalt efflux system permease component RcnA
VLGLDDRIAHLSAGGGLALAFIVALLLGLRHASDPDHLTAVSTLVMGEGRRGAHRAARLGLSWGLGHATTLFLFGLPVVLFHNELPEPVQRAAEVAIGGVIVTLGLRLLIRWRRGYFHAHPHRHGELTHAHPHVHERAPDHGGRTDVAHEHAHPEALGRSPLAAYGIGLVHGVGGSAGVGILLIGAIPGRVPAVAALALFAGATAISMAVLSSAFGRALARGPMARRFAALAPAFGTLSLLFGVWYALGALDAVPYAF